MPLDSRESYLALLMGLPEDVDMGTLAALLRHDLKRSGASIMVAKGLLEVTRLTPADWRTIAEIVELESQYMVNMLSAARTYLKNKNDPSIP